MIIMLKKKNTRKLINNKKLKKIKLKVKPQYKS